MPTRHAPWLLVLVTACGPQLGHLVAQRHYREAVCAAHDGSSDDRADVRRALAADADVHVHLEMVRAEHLERLLVGSVDDVMRRTRFARVRVQTNVIPLDGLHPSVAFTHADRTPAAAPVDWSSLAAATSERLPRPRTDSTYLHGGTAWKLLGAFFTFGMSLPFTTFRTREYEVAAPDLEYLALAPRAHALHEAMASRAACSKLPSLDGRGVGMSCEWFVAIGLDPGRELQLDVTIAYASHRARGERASEACVLEDTTSVALGSAADLDATTFQLFGPRTRRLQDIANTAIEVTGASPFK